MVAIVEQTKHVVECHSPSAKSTKTCSTIVSETSFSEDVDDVSKDSDEVLLMGTPPPRRSFFDFFLEPRVSEGRISLPMQVESRKLLKFLILIPLSTLASMAFASFFWLPLLLKNGFHRAMDSLLWDGIFQNHLALWIILIMPLMVGLIIDVVMEVYTFVMLIRGRRRRHLPGHIPRLVHAVIVCNYKEPLEVLQATIGSIADNTLSASTIVVLACEDRDTNADAVYEALSAEFQYCFRSFIKTTHKLAPGEVAGKSSNENFACRELYKQVIDEGLDPFQVMVTTCDADSLFDSVFLEQVEAEFCRMPDGRRFIYNSPINTYRNLPECNPLVRVFEVLRCQYDLFSGLGFRPAQSNYSLTLGLADELNFWDPTNTSEDFHTTLKAMAMTGKGTSVVVRVWSLIINDSVCSLTDRWTQAKRHMWGIEELAFVATLFPILRINQWSLLFSNVGSQMFSVCIPPYLFLCFPPVRELFFALRVETRCLILAMYVVGGMYGWIKSYVREVLLYRYVIGDRKLMMKRSLGEWVQIFVAWPIVSEIAAIVFATMATWRMLIHAVNHETLVYVTAPKALNNTSATTLSANNEAVFAVPTTIQTTVMNNSNTKPKKSA